MNVLRDTHHALVPGAPLLDFHPIWPPWARIEARGISLGDLVEPDFPRLLRETEGGMRTAVGMGLFRLEAEQTHELAEHYDDPDELIDEWREHISAELEERLRATGGPMQVVEKLVFRRYRALGSNSAESPTRTRPGSTTSP